MKNFDLVYSQLLKEFNVADRNDPSFYDYVVILLKQIRSNPNLIDPKKLADIRNTAMDVIEKGYYLFNDEETNTTQKIEFVFRGGKDTSKENESQPTNNLIVKINSVPPKPEQEKEIENTYNEDSISEIVNYLETKKQEAKQQSQAGTEVPAQVGETPSEMPGAEQPADTSKYIQGL